MGNLEANPDALRAHAALCEGLAGDLGAATAPACPGNFQASAAAVAALHGSVAVARSAMVDRMHSTAAAIHATADGLNAHDQSASTRLRALAQ